MDEMYIEVSGDEVMLTIPNNDHRISIHVMFTELRCSQKRIVTFRTSTDEKNWKIRSLDVTSSKTHTVEYQTILENIQIDMKVFFDKGHRCIHLKYTQMPCNL